MCRPNESCWLCSAETAKPESADSPDEGSQTGCASLVLVAIVMVSFWAGFVWAF